MKRFFSYLFAIALCITSLLTVSTATSAQAAARIMPVPFSFSDTVNLTNQFGDWPLGFAEFSVEINGTVDAQGGNVMSIDSTSHFYSGSVNCTEHDLEIEAWASPTERGVVLWRLAGTVTFTWTSPVTGLQYEKSYDGSPTFSFNANDYVIQP